MVHELQSCTSKGATVQSRYRWSYKSIKTFLKESESDIVCSLLNTKKHFSKFLRQNTKTRAIQKNDKFRENGSWTWKSKNQSNINWRDDLLVNLLQCKLHRLGIDVFSGTWPGILENSRDSKMIFRPSKSFSPLAF